MPATKWMEKSFRNFILFTAIKPGQKNKLIVNFNFNEFPM